MQSLIAVCRQRRQALQFLLAGAGLLTVPCSFAAAYPDKPVRLVVGYPAGGANDLLARQVAAKLAEVLNSPVVVENRGGANGIIGSEAVAKSAPDGYTLMLAGLTPLVLNPLTYAKLSYDTLADFTHIAAVASGPMVIAVRPDMPVTNIQELVALAKARPGKINFATVGSGGSTRVVFELFKATARVDIRYIPYKGGAQAITDVLGGQVEAIPLDLAALIPFLKAGKLRALGITSESRSSEFPDLRTMSEQGMPEMTGGNWYTVVGPAKLPQPIVAALHAALVKVANAPDFRNKLIANGMEPMASPSPDALAQFIRDELVRWGRVVKAADIRSE
jgi:tripartite-type tricarboxylate transporter receptor subunit TctC